MTISIDEFITNLYKSDYTEFEEKNDCFVVYPDKKLRNEYYKFDWIDRNKKTISNFGFLFSCNNKNAVFITKENGFYIIKFIARNY